MRHAFVHFDLNTSAFSEVRRFYETLFDWVIDDVDTGDDAYAGIRPPSGPSGGLRTNAKRAAPSQWVPYVGVDDVRAVLKRVRRAGGTVVMDYTPVPGSGAQAIVQDPGGTQLGLWEIVAVEAAATEAEVVDEQASEQASEPAKGRKKRAKRSKAVVEAAELDAPAAEAEVIEAAPAVEEAVVEAPPLAAKKKVGRRAKAKSVVEVTAPVEPEQPAVDQPAVMKTSKTSAKKATPEQPAAKKASVKKASVKKASVKAPAAKKSSTKKASTKKASAKKPAAKKASTKKPSVKKPAAKKTSVKKPAATKLPARGRR